jgi:DNA-directed RNA polymerase subunit K/omega
MKDRTKSQSRLDRRESKLLADSEYFRKLVLKGLREIKEGKVNRWKDVCGRL